jgi:F-type H+-transporting ATPase subunit b
MLHPSLLLLVANERPLINIDATLWINLVLWLVLYIVLRGLLFTPMLRLIEAREAGTSGSRESARNLSAKAQAMEAEYLGRLKDARAQAAADREKLRAEASRREAEILSEARTKMNAVVESQRSEIRTQRQALEVEIRNAVPALATDIATRVLGREVRA